MQSFVANATFALQSRAEPDADTVQMAKIRERDKIVDPNPNEYGGILGGADGRS